MRKSSKSMNREHVPDLMRQLSLSSVRRVEDNSAVKDKHLKIQPLWQRAQFIKVQSRPHKVLTQPHQTQKNATAAPFNPKKMILKDICGTQVLILQKEVSHERNMLEVTW